MSWIPTCINHAIFLSEILLSIASLGFPAIWLHSPEYLSTEKMISRIVSIEGGVCISVPCAVQTRSQRTHDSNDPTRHQDIANSLFSIMLLKFQENDKYERSTDEFSTYFISIF
jgi:hypothetical protein